MIELCVESRLPSIEVQRAGKGHSQPRAKILLEGLDCYERSILGIANRTERSDATNVAPGPTTRNKKLVGLDSFTFENIEIQKMVFLSSMGLDIREVVAG